MWKEKASVCLNAGPPFRPRQGMPRTVELHRQHIALLAARIVTGNLVNSGYFTIRKGDGVEARRFMRVLVEPEADRVLWLHVRALLVLDEGERRSLCAGPYQCPTSSSADLLRPTSQIYRRRSYPSVSYRWQGSTHALNRPNA